jgi:hypothetical protein
VDSRLLVEAEKCLSKLPVVGRLNREGGRGAPAKGRGSERTKRPAVKRSVVLSVLDTAGLVKLIGEFLNPVKKHSGMSTPIQCSCAWACLSYYLEWGSCS